MVRSDHQCGIVEPIVRSAETFGKQMRHPLCQSAGVDEDERGSMSKDVGGDLVQHLIHLAMTGRALQLVLGQLESEIEDTISNGVNDGRCRSTRRGAAEETSHDFKRALRGGQADPLERTAVLRDQAVKTLQTHGEVRPPLISSQRMDLVDDHGTNRGQACSTRG